MQIENYLIENQNYIDFFNLLNEIKYYGDWYNVDYLFIALIRFDEILFKDAFDYYCLNNYTLNRSGEFINELFENSNLNALEIYELLNKNSYDDLESCNSMFFRVIPENQIDESVFYKLIRHINTSKNFIFIPENYIKYESIFIKLQNKLNTETSNIIQFLTELLVNKKHHSENVFPYGFCREYGHYFEDNFELLKNAYFTKLSLEWDYDYNFEDLKMLCELDKSVLNEYFEWRFKNNNAFYQDNSQLNFIWDLDYNYKELYSIIKYIIENSKDFNCEGLSLLFTGKTQKEKEFIQEYIENNYENKKLIEVLFINIKKYYSNEDYLKFIEVFLRLNNDFDIFKNIIYPDFYIRNIFSEEEDITLRMDFYKKLKKILLDLDSLEYIEHMELINYEINNVEQEFKDFNKDL